MKTCTHRILFLFILFISFKAHSQVKIGDNAKTINPNSLLELESSTKGLLLPRLTNAQIKAMTNVPAGMLLFSITDSALYLRKDTGWAILGFRTNLATPQWASNGNNIFNTNLGNVGVGTNAPVSKLQVNGDLLLQKGTNINEFSKDSTFSANSDSMVPTERAIKSYLKSGKFIGGNGGGTGANSIVPVDTITQNLSRPFSVAIQGNYAYVVCAGNNQLCIYDISNPNAIVARGFTSQNLSKPNSVAIKGKYAYVVSQNNNELCIFDISNPDAIVAEGSTSQNLSNPYSVAVQGNFAYVTSSNNNQLCIFDVSNPNAIVARGFTNAHLLYPRTVAVQGNYAYVVNLNPQGLLRIYNISNPDAIVESGSSSTNLGYSFSLTVQGNYVYVPSISNSLFCIFDVSNPGAIVPRGTFSLPYPNAAAVQGNYAYVTSSSGNNQLSVLDISNPDAIVAKVTIGQNLSAPYSLAVQGNYAYVASQNNNTLAVFDYHLTPAIPVLNGDSLSYSNVLANYATQSDLNNYVSKDSVSNFVTIDSLKNFVSLTGNQTISGAKTFTANSVFKGNVGIGTALQVAKLDVHGTVHASNFIGDGSQLTGLNIAQVNGAAPITNPSFQGDVSYTGTLNMGVQYIKYSSTALANDYGDAYQGCPTGYKLIGGGGGAQDYSKYQRGITINYSGPDPDNNNRWRILYNNSSNSNVTINVYTICAKVQ